MDVTPLASARDRLHQHAREWRVDVDESFETASSLIAFGRRGAESVVLKVIKRPGDEWDAGRITRAFDGHGMVRVHEYMGGAMLLERLTPGHSLVDLATSGRDEEATAILARVVREMSPPSMMTACPTVEDWGKAFARYAATGDRRIPGALVSHAQRMYAILCASQTNTRLLHGDLQHSNVLFDERRGWVAIDPKGVIGELEYEVGAALRNPREAPALFTAPATIERRLHQLTAERHLDRARALGWAFAQAVLSVIWEIEDGSSVDASSPSLILAEAILPMLEDLPRTSTM